MSSEDLLERVAQLEARLRELEDQNEIRVLTARYNEAFDAMDVEAFVATFVPDGEFQLDDDEPLRGHAALAAFHREIGFGKVHHTADHRIEVQGDRATQVCNLVLGGRTEARAVGSAQIENTGRYTDELVRTSDGWRFARRAWAADAKLAG